MSDLAPVSPVPCCRVTVASPIILLITPKGPRGLIAFGNRKSVEKTEGLYESMLQYQMISEISIITMLPVVLQSYRSHSNLDIQLDRLKKIHLRTF